MFKQLRKPLIFKLIAWTMLGPFMIMNSGCSYFRIHRSSEPYTEVIQNMQDEQKFIILHLDDRAWHFTDITTDEKRITGTITALIGHQMYREANPDKVNRYRTAKSASQKEVLNEVHIYATDVEVTDQMKASVPVGAITRVEVYNKAKGATIASHVFVPLGVLAGAYAVLGIILLLTSCPFIYVFDGTDYLFSGEIFSGAIQPGLERDDYLPLPPVHPVDGTYKIKITNELKEKQFVNLAELIIVDHPNDVSVLFDKYGTPYTLTAPQPPLSAVTADRTDILLLLKEKDSQCSTGIEGITGENGINTITLEFVRPPGASSATLLIRARNSLWMETVSASIHEMFGERYNTFSEKRDQVPGDKLRKWQLDQNLPLSVFLEKKNKWEFVDYFNIAGPAALRDDIIHLELDGVASDTIKIKLETGYKFWETDYAAMEFSAPVTVTPVVIPAAEAIANNDLDIKEVIAGSDITYFVLDEQGDQAVLAFHSPELKDDCRSLFLHTRGYYKVLRDQTGPPDKKALKTFRKAGRIPAFSKELNDALR